MINYYLAEQIGKDRLAEARAIAAQARLLGSTRTTPDPLRVALGPLIGALRHALPVFAALREEPALRRSA